MTRRSFIQKSGALALAGSSTLLAPAVHAQSDTVRWRCASSFPKSVDTLYGTAELIARRVGQITGGKFQISVHPAGEIVPPLQVLDAVEKGTIECNHTAPYYYFGKNDAFALGCAIPFGLNSRQMSAWAYEGNGLRLMREFYRNYNIVHFPGGNT
ncbi:MAG: twin-arginine translocation signal domain-containing protein, partial [Burkholderiaceae bacterium]|nr:twin-arginine translocation signal domain-containing protein [Burkholderiaceae bacterium]